MPVPKPSTTSLVLRIKNGASNNTKVETNKGDNAGSINDHTLDHMWSIVALGEKPQHKIQAYRNYSRTLFVKGMKINPAKPREYRAC